jgi:hypothetical protein
MRIEVNTSIRPVTRQSRSCAAPTIARLPVIRHPWVVLDSVSAGAADQVDRGVRVPHGHVIEVEVVVTVILGLAVKRGG